MAHIWIERFGLPCCLKCGIVRRYDDKNSPCKGPVKVGPRGELPLGGNDEAGTVYCYLCDWKQDCGPNMERIEHELRQHIEQSHGQCVLFRTEDGTGKQTTIPK